MVAVLLVFANHLFGWPQGGFIGVDVFFVISGFLITGNLLRSAERAGHVSFTQFYVNRIRRIVPAATVVLVVTYLVATLVFQPFRARQIGFDAIAAFVFMANWWFASHETNYFAASDTVSPIQHYWSLSIEEQFYFLWPGLILLIGLLVAAKSWSHGHRMRIAGYVMTATILCSLGWALYLSATSPAWAYFDTFGRIWELGVGALLATAIGPLSQLPASIKPKLSLAGLALIAAAAFLISDGSAGFPAPWAILPVAGSALVLASGVGTEVKSQWLLSNRPSVYIGDISYSLYLVHWPVIVLLGATAAQQHFNGWFAVAVIGISFGLAILLYHFVETPLRYTKQTKRRKPLYEIKRGRVTLSKEARYAGVSGVALIVIGLTSSLINPWFRYQPPPPQAASETSFSSNPATNGGGVPGAAHSPLESGPLGSALRAEIMDALKAAVWPNLDPTVEEAVRESDQPADVRQCGNPAALSPDLCTWGSASATTRVVLVGDSVALTYAGALRDLAVNSNGRIQLRLEAMAGCPFSDARIVNSDTALTDACADRKQRTVNVINETKPDVVIISDNYGAKKTVGSDRTMASDEWANAMRRIVDKFIGSTKKVVWLSAPPADKDISQCYGSRSSTPADCASRVTDQWLSMAEAEQGLAQSVRGTWVDSRPWFCDADGLCPAFVGTTLTRRDLNHMTREYAEKIRPVIGESLAASGVFDAGEGTRPSGQPQGPPAGR